MKQKAFKNVRRNSLHLTFPNGNWISTIWGPGSYSENHDTYADYESWKKAFDNGLESNTVEVMVDCPEKLKKRIHKKFEGDGSVIGYLNITQWLEILKLLAK